MTESLPKTKDSKVDLISMPMRRIRKENPDPDTVEIVTRDHREKKAREDRLVKEIIAARE